MMSANVAALLALIVCCTAAPAPTMNIVELAASVPDLSTLVTAVKAAGLVDTLSGTGPFTVFAPTNEAFAALPPGVLASLLKPENKAELVKVLTYHVVAGNVQAADLKNDEKIKTVEGDYVTALVRRDQVTIVGGERGNFAEVIKANVEASNGVVHVIDHVLLPPTAPPAPPAPSGNQTIVELAASVPDLSTLVTAVKAAGLVDTLSGTGPFTVFAPTNEAFAALPPGVLASLLKPENKAELVKVLTYHVVAGNVQAADLKNGEDIKTVEGAEVTALVRPPRVIIVGGERDNFAEVIKADVEASNGVVHVIDHVLLPPRHD